MPSRSTSLSILVVLALLSLDALAEEEKPMVVEDGKSVSIEYTLTLDDGSTADSNVGGEPLVYTQGGGEILPGLESALLGMRVTEVKQVKLDAEQAYGPVDPNAYQKVETTVIPEDARYVGAQLLAEDAAGRQRPVRVHEVTDEQVTLDLNHPLAGRNLIFDVKVLEIE